MYLLYMIRSGAFLQTEAAQVLKKLVLGNRVSTESPLAEVTLVFVLLGALQGPVSVLSLTGGVSPRGPHRDKH